MTVVILASTLLLSCFSFSHFPHSSYFFLSYTLLLSSVQFSHSFLSESLRPLGLHGASLSITNSRSLLKLMSIDWWCHPTISSSVVPFSSYLQSEVGKWSLLHWNRRWFSFPTTVLFKRVSSSHQVAKVLKFQLQHQFFQWIFRTDLLWDGLVVSPCSPRDSQESSPTPQLKRINSLALSFLYSPNFTSIYDYCKNHSLN